jgi:type IV pilus assembly protein PilQ
MGMMLKRKLSASRRIAILRLAAMAQAGVLALAGLTANAQELNRLEDIQVQSLPGQRVELKLVMSDLAPEPLAFTIDNPARIALDLPDTAVGLSSRRRDVNLGPLDTVLTAEANGRTRVVLNLDKMVGYKTSRSGNTITVMLGDGGNYSDGTTQFTAAAPSSSSRPASTGSAGRAITNVDFRRTRDGGGRVVVNLTDPGTPVDIRQEGGRVVAIFKDTSLPPEMMRRMDVMDFATPVQTVDTLRTNLDTRIVISAEGKYEQLAYQSDNEFTIEVNPAPEEDSAESSLFSESKEYEGQRLTLNFQDIETRAVLQLLAETSGKNIVVSDTVQGNVTLRLRNVPWDQALDIVMTTKGLDMRQNGNVIIVAPAEEIAARETADLEAKQAISELEPLYSEFLQVNYAKASDLSSLIAGDSQNAMLSERGSIAVDERTNTLLVSDTAQRLQDIRRMVRTLDIPIKQVLIESRIVIVNDDFSRDLGVRLGVTGNDISNDSIVVYSGTGEATNNYLGSITESLNDPTGNTPVLLPALASRYNVNVPIANPAGRFSLAVLGEDYLVDLELTALEAEGRGEIVSTPRVITANQKEAIIEQGVEIPYQQSASSGATTIQFKKAVLSLTVTPQITPDNNIIMDLKVH